MNPDYLSATHVVDRDHPEVIRYALDIVAPGTLSPQQTAIDLYQRVRDDFAYNPYIAFHQADAYRASVVLKTGKGYCVSKASLLCALGRVHGIPSRLGFATVRNHIATKQLIELMGTNEFAYHGFTEFFLDDKWVVATPAFDAKTCARHKVAPLEFNGIDDSKYQAFDNDNNLFMEYLESHGSYADVPIDQLISHFREKYGNKLVNDWIQAFDAMKGIAKRRFDREEVA